MIARSGKKQKAYRYGLAAEKIAAIFLRMKGYRIIAERYSNPFGEIDIIAAKGKILVVVEVKARQNISDGIYSITPHKQEKIARALEWFLAGGGKIAGLAKMRESDIRFDAILIVPRRWPRHLKDAWRT